MTINNTMQIFQAIPLAKDAIHDAAACANSDSSLSARARTNQQDPETRLQTSELTLAQITTASLIALFHRVPAVLGIAHKNLRCSTKHIDLQYLEADRKQNDFQGGAHDPYRSAL